MTARDGKSCKKCGSNEWYKDGRCVVCYRARSRQWRKNNAERVQEYNRQWRGNNPDYLRQWRSDNPEKERVYRNRRQGKAREIVRQWWKSHPEKAREYSRNWRAQNPEKSKETHQRWRANNSDKVNAANQRRRAKLRGVGGAYTAAEWQALCRYYKNCCLACGRNDVKLTADHVIPLAQGGSNDISNIQPLCLSCNSHKSNHHIDYRTKQSVKRWIQKKLFG